MRNTTNKSGNNWLIPVARVSGGGSPVFRLDVDEDGNWIAGEPPYALKALVDDAENVWQQLVAIASAGEEKARDLKITVEHDLGIRGLAANYAVGRFEVAALGLLDNRSALQIALALIDWPTIVADMEAQKKTLVPIKDEEAGSSDGPDPDGLPTSSGGAASHPDTGRPTQTSTG